MNAVESVPKKRKATGQLLVRNLPDEVIDQLKQRAQDAGVSAEEEHRRILIEALSGAADRVAFALEAKALRDELAGRIFGDSTDIIRQARDDRTRQADEW